MNYIKNFFSGNSLFKIGAAAGVLTAVICFICLGIHTVRTADERMLEEEGEALFSEDLPDDYYKELQTRFVNNYGETYEHYRITEGLGISFFGDGGIVDEIDGYSVPGIVSLGFLERFIYIMGNPGETPETAAARQGGVPMYARPFTIPAGQESTTVTLINEYGDIIVPVLENNGGLNPCTIAGVEGNISVDENGNTYFTRLEEGKQITTENDTVVTTRAMKNRRQDITVVFLQELPEGYSAGKYAEILEKMRDYQNIVTGDKCFYVISPILNTDREKAAELDSLLEESFGEYYINAREYLSGDAIEKYNFRVWDEEDIEAVERGQICSSFLTRNGQLNFYGMYAIAELFTDRINENDSELLEMRFEYNEE